MCARPCPSRRVAEEAEADAAAGSAEVEVVADSAEGAEDTTAEAMAAETEDTTVAAVAGTTVDTEAAAVVVAGAAVVEGSVAGARETTTSREREGDGQHGSSLSLFVLSSPDRYRIS